MSRKYRKFDSSSKALIIRKHLLDKIPVSSLCEAYQIHPSLFYKWQKELFDNAEQMFGVQQKPKEDSQEKARIKQLEAKLAQKNEVLAELMQEHIQLKKEYGEI
jgi:transposase-like protein